MASRGEDASTFFTNTFMVVRPIRRVNIDLTRGVLRELCGRAAQCMVSRQAVIKALLAEALRVQLVGKASVRVSELLNPVDTGS
jgi:hypothetical protein